jgi:hypothetical protein
MVSRISFSDSRQVPTLASASHSIPSTIVF